MKTQRRFSLGQWPVVIAVGLLCRAATNLLPAATTLELSNNTHTVEITGEYQDKYLGGRSAQTTQGVLLGDVNGDDYDDLICALPDFSGVGNLGKVYITTNLTASVTGQLELTLPAAAASQFFRLRPNP